MLYGDSFLWTQDLDEVGIACPDPENAVVFELRRTWLKVDIYKLARRNSIDNHPLTGRFI